MPPVLSYSANRTKGGAYRGRAVGARPAIGVVQSTIYTIYPGRWWVAVEVVGVPFSLRFIRFIRVLPLLQ